MPFSADPELTVQEAIKKLKEEGWVHEKDQLVTVTNILADGKVIEGIQLRGGFLRKRIRSAIPQQKTKRACDNKKVGDCNGHPLGNDPLFSQRIAKGFHKIEQKSSQQSNPRH